MKVFELLNSLPKDKKIFILYRGVTISCWPQELCHWATRTVKKISVTANIKTIEVE